MNYDYGVRMPLDLMEVGFQRPDVRFTQPVYLRGPEKRLWELSVREAMPVIVKCGVESEDALAGLFDQMRMAAEDENTLIGQWGMVSAIAVK